MPLSVVVVPIVGGEGLARLLADLAEATSAPVAAEVLGVGPNPPAAASVAWVETPEGTPVPARRAAGARRASGLVVAFVEDTVQLGSGWAEAVVRLHAAHPTVAAIGGTLRISPDLGPRRAALALLDYGRFVRGGETSEAAEALPGNVLSFKRAALEAELGRRADGLREAELVPSLLQQGRGVRLESSMGATCVDADPRGSTPASRFHHGRLYAGRRFVAGARVERLARAALAPLLALVLAFRAAACARAAGLPRQLVTLAHVLWMSAAWSLGEAVGYLFGAGRSERHWT